MSFLGKEPFYFKSLPTTDGCQLITVKPNQAKVREQEGRGGQWREVALTGGHTDLWHHTAGAR